MNMIKQQADYLLNQFNGNTIPVDVIKIANNLDIEVFDEELPVYENGWISQVNNGRFEITINRNQAKVRRRFSVAHEIAHFIFDKDYIAEHGSIDRDGNPKDASYREREIRANKFASEILMPEYEFIEMFCQCLQIDRLADYFFVSKDAAQYRAMNLGLLSA